MNIIDKSERKRMRVEASMLYRDANQFQDMPDDASKVKARKMFLEAEQIKLMLKMVR